MITQCTTVSRGSSHPERAWGNFLGSSRDLWRCLTIHVHGHRTLPRLLVKVQATFVLQSLNFHPHIQGENSRDDCARDERGLPTSLPRFIPTATFFHVHRLFCTPSTAFLEQHKLPGWHTSKHSSWLVFTHRESGQAASYASAPLPPLQDPLGSGPPAFLHIWAVSSWRLPSILGLIFGTIQYSHSEKYCFPSLKKADRTRNVTKCTMTSCNMHLWLGEKWT